jgi:hypothetical protein
MGAQNQTSVTLVGVGGSSPYVFTVLNDAQTTIPATISGNTLTVDATNLEPGVYSVHVQMTDQLTNTSTAVIPVTVVASNILSITNVDVALQPTTFPQTVSVPLTSIGGVGAVVWTLIANLTTLPGATVTGSTLGFSATTFGNWTVALRVTDSLGNTATRLIEINVVTADVTSLVDGQVEIDVTPTPANVGTHTFTLKISDSSSGSPVSRNFNYTIAEEISAIEIAEASINHVWGANDVTSVVYPIAGALSGFTIGTEGSIVADNGLTVSIDTENNAVVVTGPPTSFENSEVEIQIPVMRNSQEVAILTREFTLVSHNGSTDIGTMICNTRPYITGEYVGLNPLRPFYNSPAWAKNQSYIVQLATGNTLPQGLSLDSVSGQIYGTVLANDVPTSVLQYVDASGNVHGTVTINWTVYASQYTMLNNLTSGQVQVAYNGTVGTSSSAKLTTVAVSSGRLPQGLSVTIDTPGANVVISGTPVEAGYFDVWFRVTNSNGQVAFFYTRFVVDYIPPLVILTESLPDVVTNQSYSQTLQAFGGIAPYIWALASGTLPSGFTLNANSGVISGTTAATSYNQTLTFAVTDTRGVTSTAAISLEINNSLEITTAVLPLVTPGQNYVVPLAAQGGVKPYTWALASGSPALPGGFTLSSSGVLSGATSLEDYNQNVVIQVTDSASNSVTKTFTLLIGTTSGILIDTEGIGPIARGQAYQGQASVIGPGVAPFSWSVTTDTPNQLPTGMSFTGDTSDSGATATLSGLTDQNLLNYAVKIEVIDANGNYAFAFLLLNSFTSLVVTTATPIPQATVGGSYSQQLTEEGGVSPFVWSLDPSSGALPAGLTLSSTGVLSGVPSAQGTTTFTVRVTDSLGDFATKALTLTAVTSTLAITTPSLPQATSGVAYSASLAASGGNPAYTWSISPASASSLPTGLSLNASTGAITGTTLSAGFSKSITFRVTDSIGVYKEVTLTLTVIAGLKLYAGPDYVNGTSVGSLGIGYTAIDDVTSINPRPNLSFFVVATGVISTQVSGISFGLPPGFNATVSSLSNGVAYIELSGNFYGPSTGTKQFNITVIDSGVSVSATFTYSIQPQQNIRLTPVTGTLPVFFLN